MDWSAIFDSALTYENFLQQYGSERDQQRWQSSLDAAELLESQKQLLETFSRKMHLICMAGAWCGDCVESCPIFRQFELACPNIELRFVDRDVNQELKSALTIIGASRVPQTVILSEDFQLVDRLGDRTLNRYREIAAKITGASCSTGLIIPGDPLRLAVIQDWLNEIERCQLVLRTSPSLREKYGD